MPSCSSSGITCNSLTNCTIPGTVATPFDAACVYANGNGYANHTTGYPKVTIIANSGASSPVSGNNPDLWFQVTITDQLSPLFAGFGGVSLFTIAAQASAAVTQFGSPTNCIIALATSGTVLTDTAGGNVTASNCDIYANAGLSHSGGGTLTASKIFYDSSNGTCSSPCPVGATAVTSTASDPFANVVAPAVGACPATGPGSIGYNYGSTTSLTAGVYCGGLKLSNSSTITFGPGMYIINGSSGGKSLDWSNSGELTGTGVTFFITGKNGQIAGPINVTGGGPLALTAPTSGPYKGLLFYQDPSVTYAQPNKFTQGGSASADSGTIYFKTTALQYTGGGASSYTAIVASTVTFTGGGAVGILADNTGQYTGLVSYASGLIQ